jgi:hypothetical protein
MLESFEVIGFQTKIFYVILFYAMCAICSVDLMLPDFMSILIIFWRLVQVIKLLSMYFSTTP